MTSEHFTLTPPGGWPSFVRRAELEALISEYLPVTDSGGIWRYYGFTSWTAVWSSDTSPDSILCLSFAGYPTEAPSHVDELSIVLSDDQSEHYQQLSTLVQRLISDFALRAAPSTTSPPNDRNA